MSISPTELIWALVIAGVLAGSLVVVFIKQRKEVKSASKANYGAAVDGKQMQLQAYERLMLLTDRIAIPSLINRLNQPGLSAKDMQVILVQSIRQEFDHNITQRIYVSKESWDAVSKLKEQNLLIIHQVASMLPDGASAHDLNKSLLELVMQNPNASLHNIVAEALSYEAKKLM